MEVVKVEFACQSFYLWVEGSAPSGGWAWEQTYRMDLEFWTSMHELRGQAHSWWTSKTSGVEIFWQIVIWIETADR